MKLCFSSDGWDDYQFWQKTDAKVLRNINDLIKECLRTPFSGTGQPEALRNKLSGLWSRRIDRKYRLVYRVLLDSVEIIQCRFHYDDK